MRFLRPRWLCILVLLLCYSKLGAQTPEPVTPLPTGVSSADCFNPNIAAFDNGGTKTLCVAYTYVTGTHRKIAVSKSTDEGTNWSTPVLPALPYWNGGSTDQHTDMDDAQLLYVDCNRLVLVVRAWDNTSNVFGTTIHEQPKSVFKKVGIYICFSTDGGSTWGHMNGSTYTSGIWKPVEENDYTDVNNHATLEYPRIAYRYNAGNIGYPYHTEFIIPGDPTQFGHIVWTKKVYTGETPPLTISSTSIGTRKFTAFDPGCPLTGFADITPIQFFNPYLSISVPSGYVGPERASVAVSHDGGVWLAYYQCKYDASDNTTDFYIMRDAETPVQVGSTTKLPGKYENLYGSIYERTIVPDADFFRSSDRLDLAQGPSIEIASKEPHLNCASEIFYQIGYAYTYQDNSTASKRRVSVRTANLQWGSSTSTAATALSGSEQMSTVDANEATDSKSRFYPTLTVANAKDHQLTYKTMEGVSSNFSPSFLVLGYIEGELVSGSPDNFRCRVAFSFDNNSFQNSIGNATLRSAEAINSGCMPSYKFGTKMDVAASSIGNLTIYPAWRRCTNGGTNDGVYTNSGGAYIVKPYLRAFPANNPEAYPTGNMFNPGSGWYNVYNYFEFDQQLNRPGLTTTTTFTSANVGAWDQETTPSFIQPNTFSTSYGLYYGVFKPQTANQGFLGFSDQRKAVAIGNVTFAVTELNGTVYYTQTRGLDPATAGNFDQVQWTEIVPLETVTGVTQSSPAIAVYQQGKQTQNGLLSGYYFFGEETCFTGEGAIAATWVEKTENVTCGTKTGTLVKIKMRTREVNVCNGVWSPWSSVYTIHTHFHKSPEGTELPDNTTPVIAPIVTPKSYSGTQVTVPRSDNKIPSAITGVPTYLLGWTITWTGPKIIAMPGIECPTVAETRSVEPEMDEWLYSRNWMRVNDDGSQRTANDVWGTYVIVPNQKLMPFGAAGVFNDLFSNIFVPPFDPATVGHEIRFPTITSSENKYRWWDANDNYRHEIAFSTVGTNFRGVWHTAAIYDRTAPNFGALIAQTPHFDLSTGNINNKRDRNPCITMNSSGQVFVAWESKERKVDNHWYHQILVRQTDIVLSNGFQGITMILDEQTSNITGTPPAWAITNPSITGFPKSRTHNWLYTDDHNDLVFDRDFGCVELLFAADHVVNFPRDIRSRHYFEDRRTLSSMTAPEGIPCPEATTGNQWTGGNWPRATGVGGDKYTVRDRTSPHKSFSTRQHSPFFLPGPTAYDVNPTSSLELTNTTDVNGVLQSVFYNYRFDAYKETPVDIYADVEYRSEYLSDGSTTTQAFIGSVDLTDKFDRKKTVLMGYAYPPPGAAYFQARDSVLHTARFNWESGAELAYDRFIGAFLEETVSSTAGALLPPAAYVVELVRPNGHIVTLEHLVGDVRSGSVSSAKRAHIVNLGEDESGVYLRLRNISDADVAKLEKDLRVILKADGRYTFCEDTMLAPLQIQTSQAIGEGILAVGGVFPNPVMLGSSVSALVSSQKGSEITAEICDQLGRSICEPQSVNGNGNWQKMSFAVPQAEGAYFLRLRAGGVSRTLPFRVLR